MRISIVPAQITTVEDKLIGNISVHQATLLGVPILLGFFITIILPPAGQVLPYKTTIIIGLFFIGGLLAIRIKGRITASWLRLLIIYMNRPQEYRFNKNSLYLRDAELPIKEVGDNSNVSYHIHHPIANDLKISEKEYARLEQLSESLDASIRFNVNKKGNLDVHITKIQ